MLYSANSFTVQFYVKHAININKNLHFFPQIHYTGSQKFRGHLLCNIHSELNYARLEGRTPALATKHEWEEMTLRKLLTGQKTTELRNLGALAYNQT
jgi:hypothetical protein